MKKEVNITIWITILILLVSTISALTSNSSTYKTTLDVNNGGTASTNSSNYNTKLTITNVGDNTSSDNYELKVGFIHTLGGDTTGPNITNIGTNTSTIRYNDIVKFNATCTDQSSIHGYIFSHNNSEEWVNESYVSTSGSPVEVSFTYQVTLIQNDTLGWQFICNDTAGNLGFSDIQSFDINNTVPKIPTIIYPDNNAILAQLDINYSSFDLDNDTINYTIYINNTFNISSRNNITNLEINDGSYNVSVSAYDQIGYSQNASIVIIIDTTPPEITLVTPINKSGDNDANITFTYTVTDAISVTNCTLYINDLENQTDQTITKGIYQNFTLNDLEPISYNWSIGCINIISNNATSGVRNVAVIKTTKYSGQTTEFSTVNVFEVPNLILEIPDYGKLDLLESIDLSKGIDFDKRVNISLNRIMINGTYPLSFNTSSDIYLYNITFSNPQVLKDGTTCSDCLETSFKNKTFRFNVTELTSYNNSEIATYSSRETPIPPKEEGEAAPSAGGGGGGSPATLKDLRYDFRLDKKEIKATLKIGRDDKTTLEIRNLGTEKISLSLDIEELRDFVSISDYNFDLNAGERKTIIINMIGKRFGLFVGRLILTTQNVIKSIPIILEIESQDALFDAKLDIPSNFKQIAQDQDLRAQITLFNVLGGKVDVMVNYLIKDLQGNLITEESETFAVEKQSSYVKIFDLPPDLNPGQYVAAIEVRYANSYALSSQMFEVLTEEELISIKEARNRVISIFVIVAISSLIYVVVITRLLKRKKRGF